MGDYRISYESTLHLVLRLRGGASCTIYATRGTTGKMMTVNENVSLYLMSLKECQASLQRKLPTKLSCQPVYITRVKGKDVSAKDRGTTFLSLGLASNVNEVKVSYQIMRVFKDILKAFSTTGAANSSLWNMLTVKNAAGLRSAQKSANKAQIPDNALMTLATIKILHEHF